MGYLRRGGRCGKAELIALGAEAPGLILEHATVDERRLVAVWARDAVAGRTGHTPDGAEHLIRERRPGPGWEGRYLGWLRDRAHQRGDTGAFAASGGEPLHIRVARSTEYQRSQCR